MLAAAERVLPCNISCNYCPVCSHAFAWNRTCKCSQKSKLPTRRKGAIDWHVLTAGRKIRQTSMDIHGLHFWACIYRNLGRQAKVKNPPSSRHDITSQHCAGQSVAQALKSLSRNAANWLHASICAAWWVAAHPPVKDRSKREM